MLQAAMADLQADPAAAEAAADAFQRLKPICAQLLGLRNQPQAMTAALAVLRDTIEGAPAAGLARCYDYVTYPLLFMLEAATAMRAPAGSTSTNSSSSSSSSSQRPQPMLSVPAMQQDGAVEALLQCVLVLLQRCRALESDQLMPLLQHVGSLLQLPRGSLSEEVRLICFQILQAALHSQRDLPQQQQLLQAPAGRMLGGFLISTCLSAAEDEVAVGPTGSKAVRQAAIRALGGVVRVLGPGPQLAFALPGLASGLTKQLMAAVPSSAGVSLTGAAAGSTGTILVLKTLGTVIQLTVGDSAIAHIPDTAAATQQQQQQLQDASSSSSSRQANFSTSDGVLGVLQQLSIQAGTGSIAAASSSGQNGVADETAMVLAEATNQRPQQQQQQEAGGVGVPPLSAQQDPTWLANSSSKVQTLLALALPRLLTHKQPAVRQALAEVTADLLRTCSRALHNSSVALTEILLTLANDDFTSVAQPAIRFLQGSGRVQHSNASQAVASGVSAVLSSTAGQAAGLQQDASPGLKLSTVAARLRNAVAARALAGADGSSAAAAAGAGPLPPLSAAAAAPAAVPVLSDLLVDLCLQLPASLRQSEAVGTAAAKRTAAALLCTDPQVVARIICSKVPVLQQVCAALVAAFQMDPTGAVLLLRADTAVLGELPADDASNAPAAAAAAGQTGSSKSGPSQQHEGSAGAPNAAARPTSNSSSSSYPLLPRMPLSLQYLVSREGYKAAAGVARALGRSARLADTHAGPAGFDAGSGNLQSIVSQLLQQLQAASSPHKPSTQGHHAAPTPAAGEWQCNTAAVAAVLTEVLFGACAAWEPPLAANTFPGLVSPKQSTQSAAAATTAAAAKAAADSAADAPTSQQVLSHQRPLDVDTAYVQVLLQVVTAVVKPKLWGLPTSQSAGVDSSAASRADKQDTIPAQVLGANALLLRCLLDCVGTCARCASSAFSSGSSRPLRTCLLPLLERLADPCPLVSTAAAGALDSICRHTGYPLGLSQLVGANADYVVDGVCRQLRSLQQHPRAPQLLAALLREAGVSAALMPLLAEPLRAALSGVSILARQQQPGYVLPFLYVLESVAAGAGQEAQACRHTFTQQLQQSVAEAHAAGLVGADSDADSSGDEGVEGRQAAGDTAAARYFKQRLGKAQGDADSSADTQQQQQQGDSNSKHTAAAAAASAAAAGKLDIPMLPTSKKLRLAAAQLEELDLSWRRAFSAGSLAAAAVDAATPLLLQRNLRCAVLAVRVLAAALQALAAATQAVDTEEQLFERVVDRGPDAALKPTRPTPAKLLPAVHGIWPVLVAALQDTGSVALLEQQLGLLAQLVQLAGGKFMARRFKQDAWPLLLRLLKAGPQGGAAALAASTASSTVGGGAAAAALLGVGSGPGGDSSRELLALPQGVGSSSSSKGCGGGSSVFGSALSSMRASAGARSSLNAAHGSMVSQEQYSGADEGGPMAPASLQRVQLAVMACLTAIAGCSSAAAALQGPLVWDLCVLVAPYLADNQAVALREAAAKLLVTAAAVDADAVWLLLLDLGSCYQDLRQLLPADTPSSMLNGTGATTGSSTGSAERTGGAFLSVQQLLLPNSSSARGSGAVRDSALRKLLGSGDAVSCGRRAAALLPRVAAAPVAWHVKAEGQLWVLQEASG